MPDFVAVHPNDQWVLDTDGRVIGVRRFGQHAPAKHYLSKELGDTSVPVLATTNPLTGGIELSAGGVTVPIRVSAPALNIPTVIPGTPVLLDVSSQAVPFTATVTPGVSGTMLLEWSASADAATSPGAAQWFPWEAGTVTAAKSTTFVSPVNALRFTATTSNGTAGVSA